MNLNIFWQRSRISRVNKVSKLMYHLKPLKITHVAEFTFATERTIDKNENKELVKEND